MTESGSGVLQLACRGERLEPLLQSILAGLKLAASGEREFGSMHLLESVLEHRAVSLLQQVVIDVDRVARVDT